MHNTWHRAPASIRRHKAHSEQSAHNTGYQDNQKGWNRPLDIIFSRMSARFPWITFPPPTPMSLCAICTFLLAPPRSVSIVLWISVPVIGRGVHDVTRDTPEAKDSSTKNPPLCRKRRYRCTCTSASLHWQNNAQQYQQSLTVQQVVHALPGLPWPSPQHDDIHPLVLLWRPRVPANSKLSFRN